MVGVWCAQHLLWASSLLLFKFLWFHEKKKISLELVILFISPGPFYLFSNLGKLFLVT